MKKIKVGFGNKKVTLEAKELSYFEMLRGLMFRGRESDNLIFNRNGKWAIHSFFVFFPFLALWLDEKNRVVEHRMVQPFSFHIRPKKEFAKLIELPINDRNKKVIGLLNI